MIGRKEQRVEKFEDTEFHFMYFITWAPSHILLEVIKKYGTYNAEDLAPTGKALRACIGFSQKWV